MDSGPCYQFVRTVTYKSVLDRANVHFAGKVNATADDTASLNVFINARYREFFERFFWQEMMRVEQRTFRPAYDGTATYAASTATAATEVYYWPSEAYYQALRNQPVTLTTLERGGTGNLTATATYAAGHNLTVGSTPRITISGAAQATFNGTWTATVTSSTQFTYVMPADPGADATGTLLAGINPTNSGNQTVTSHWAVGEPEYTPSNEWGATVAYSVGTLVYQPLDGRTYQCILAHTNQQPPNTSYWGVLTPFKRDIDFDPSATSNQGATATAIGEVQDVWSKHPWIVEDAEEQDFSLTSDGVVVRGGSQVVYLHFRIRPNDFTGNTWVTSGVHAVGDQVYYTVTGEYYVCIQATSGQNPATTTHWTKLDFPYVLKAAVAHAAYADLLKVTGKSSKWGQELKEAYRLLQIEFDKVERLQGQTKQLNVQTR